MNLTLVNKLIERHILKVDSEIEAVYRTIDLSGYERTAAKDVFVVLEIILTEDGPVFYAASTHDGKRRQIRYADISRVDGMEPVRIACIYDMDDEGGYKAPPRRRGRLPRSKLA